MSLELECPWCGGLIYKPYTLIMKPYKCVVCEKTFSFQELINPTLWKLIRENRDYIDRDEIVKLLRELL